MDCKKCGAELQNDDTFCAACGEDCKNQEKEAVKCNECGKFFNKEFGMCPFCGTELAEDNIELTDNQDTLLSVTDTEEAFVEENTEGDFVLCPICNNKYDVNVGLCTICGYSSLESDETVAEEDEASANVSAIEDSTSDKLQNTYNSAYSDTEENKPVNYKKIGIISAVVIGVILVISLIVNGSKLSGVSMNQIELDISELSVVTNGVIESEYTPFTPYTVDSVEIEKRQTNIDDKEDIVYCNVVISNEYYQTDLQIKLVYNYYDDGGWIKDGNSVVSETTVPVAAIKKELVDDINIELKGKDVTLTYNNIKSIDFNETTSSSTINYEYTDEIIIASGALTIYFEDNKWERVDDEKFELKQLSINWSSNVFVSNTSGDNEYWSYLHNGRTQTQAIGTLYYVNANEKENADSYHRITMPVVDYELSITNVSAETGKISGTLTLESGKTSGYYRIKNGSIKIPFECDFDTTTGKFVLSKTLDVLSYRTWGYNDFRDPTYRQVDVTFEVSHNFSSNKWNILKFKVDKVNVGSNLLCDWGQYQSNIH